MRLKQCIFALVAMLLCAFSATAQGGSVAKIGNTEYTTFADAMAAANAATGNVDVEVYGAVEFIDGMELNGSYSTITFTGKSAEAKITINQTAGGDYLTAHGKTVAFNDLILAKANPAWSGNSGHMGNYFSIQGGTVAYTDCTFPNGACTSGGTATYDNCTFQNTSEYGLWVYDDALVTVNGGTIDSKKGIKVYSEDEQSVTSTLTVKNATFTANVSAKPAVAVGYAESITLIGNTYNNTTAHVELDSGSDADCEGITFVAQDSEGNDIASTLEMTDRSNSSAPCGVLVDGKIYTTVTEAAAEATEGSTVTLLYDSTEEVELPEGVTLDKNGYTADNVTVATSGVAQVGENVFTTVLEALQYAIDNNAAELKILCDVREKMTIDFDLNINADLTITADAPVKVEFYNDGTAYDFAVGSTNNNTLTIGENVHFDLVDRVIWLGYWGNNVTVVVNGYLGGYQIWHGANTVVNGTLDSHGEAFIMRRDATLTANEGAKVNANYFQIYSGHIVAENATITAGLVWVNNNHSYGNEGTVSFELDNTEFTSNGEVKIYAGEGKIVSVTLENSSSFDAKGVVTLGDNVKVVADATSSIQDANGPVVIPVAKVNGVEYATLAEAVAAATEGATITMLGDVALTETVTLPAGITFNGNGKFVDGEVWAAGNLTFVGHTKVAKFNAGYNKPVITIGEGACLETSSGRMVIGHGATFNITGSIEDAKTADVAALTPSLIMPGASFTGAGVTFNVTNAYISAPSSYCSSSKSASGTFDFNITNSIWESADKLAFESQSTAATVNFDLVESVLNTGSHLVFGVSRGEVVIDNSNVNVGTSRQIENQSTMTIKNGSVVNGAVATSSNAKNPGTLIVENATYAVTGEFSGSDLGTGTLIVKKGATVSAGSITNANIQIDATGMAAGDVINLTANLSNLAGTIEVVNNDNLDASIVDGKIVLAVKPVAKIGDVEYTSLEDAFEAAAATAEATITLIEDLTIESDLKDAGKGYFNVADGKKVTLDLGGKTITATDNSTGNFILFYSYGEFTIKNGTVVLTATNDRDWNAQSTIVLNRGGIFNCESGTYTHNGGTDMAFVFDNSGNYYGDATTNIKGGELTSTYIAIRNRMEQNSHGASGKAILNVTGGKINGTSRAIWAQAASTNETAPATGAINVSGGEVGLIDTPRSTGAVSMTTISGGTVAAFKGEAGELTVKGGTIGNVEILTAAGEATDYAITADGVYAQAVAKIGDTYYATLQAAVEAVKDGETITLIDNVTVSEATAAYNDGTYIDGVRYTGDKSFTVDFNGKTVTDDGCVNDYLIYINNKGEKASEITFTNGTIVSKNGCWSAVCVNSSAATQNVVLNLNGMNITNSNDAEYSGNPVVRVRDLATVNVNDGTIITSNGASYGVAASTDGSTLNINEGATIVQQNSGTTGGNSVFAAVGGKGVINIKGGTITSDRYGVHTMTTGTPVINISGGTITAPVALKSSTNGGNGELATINVTGGTINGTLETYTENGKIVVSGGTFSEAVAQEYCAEGFVPKDNGDGTYGVEEAPAYVAQVGDAQFETLSEAVAAAQAGQTVTLLADVETADGIVITDKNLTIDLNGKTYTVTEGASTNNRNFKINGASVVTVKNGIMVAAGDYSSGAYGTIRTEGTANVTLTGLKLYNYRGNGLNIKACAGTTVTVKDTEIYANYGGGIESAGGTIVVDNVTVEQKGMYTAPYNSMAISVNGGGKVTVNSGTYSTECITAEEANNQGTSHGPWVAGVLNSGGTLIINGGTFSNDNFGENSLATYARGAILADTKAKVEINGGKFNVLKNVIDIQNNLGDANNNPSVVLAGGTYNADPRISAQYGSNLITLADGCVALPDLNGNYVVGVKPTATVNNLGQMTIPAGGYTALSGGNGEDMPLSFVMQFLADQDAEDMETSPYAEWYGDFVITFTGLENGSASTEGCYLAGYYGDFGWVKVPVEGLLTTIENGVRYPVMLGVGMGQKYDYICAEVKDFRCAMYLPESLLEANPNLKVNLELAVVDNSNGEDAAASALVNNDKVYSVAGHEYDAEDFVVDPNYIAELLIDDAKGENYTNDTEKRVGTLTYKRTLVNGKWNALYLPFEVELTDELLANYDFADYNQMISHDTNGDRVPDSYEMELFIYTSGTLEANYPYFVRPKNEEACSMNLVLTDATLYPANENSLVTSSVKNTFKLSGTYSAMGAEELAGKYAISIDGDWSYTSALKPYRLYLTITDNNGAVVASGASKSVRIVVRGEDGTTEIEGVYENPTEDMIFDLQGRRVLEPQKGGMYIINGKKVIF